MFHMNDHISIPPNNQHVEVLEQHVSAFVLKKDIH